MEAVGGDDHAKARGGSGRHRQYRDLWLVPHGRKLVMSSMLNGEYVRATGWAVPGSQAGWENNRSCTEMTLALRIATEHAALASKTLCVGFQDQSTCFMSIIKRVQSVVEKEMGVRLRGEPSGGSFTP
jgi:hypothetical protein